MNNKQFFININGVKVDVTEEIYLAYYRSKRRDKYYEYDIKTETAVRNKEGCVIGYASSKEDSLDRLIAAGEDFMDKQESVEDTVICDLTTDALHKAMDKLPEADRELIDALFFSNGGEGMTERECAGKFGISKTAFHARKIRVLVLMKNIIENNF